MRINLFGGPGAGKSTTAAWLFSEMKRRNYSVELVSEYVKSWAIAKRPVIGFDQIYLMGKQMNYEFRFLSNGIDHIVTDSPVLLSACYAKKYFDHLNVASHMEAIIAEYDRLNPSLNIFINRDGKEYRTEGRYQSADEASQIDLIVRDTLLRNGVEFKEFSFFDTEGMLAHVQQSIPPSNV